MKSRLALTTMIVLGMLMSGGGASLAITGASGQGDAAQLQYRPLEPEQEQNGNDFLPPDQNTISDEGDEPLAGAEQVSVAGDSGDSLPFTGFLAIPLLIGGVALVTTGALLRRKAGRADE